MAGAFGLGLIAYSFLGRFRKVTVNHNIIPGKYNLMGKSSLSRTVWMRGGLGELLLEPLINHFSNGPSLPTSATHVLSAGHDPGHLWPARG